MNFFSPRPRFGGEGAGGRGRAVPLTPDPSPPRTGARGEKTRRRDEVLGAAAAGRGRHPPDPPAHDADRAGRGHRYRSVGVAGRLLPRRAATHRGTVPAAGAVQPPERLPEATRD